MTPERLYQINERLRSYKQAIKYYYRPPSRSRLVQSNYIKDVEELLTAYNSSQDRIAHLEQRLDRERWNNEKLRRQACH